MVGVCECGGIVVSYDGVYAICERCGKIYMVNWSQIGQIMIEILIKCDGCGREIEVKGLENHEKGILILTNASYYQSIGKVLCRECSRKFFKKLFYKK